MNNTTSYKSTTIACYIGIFAQAIVINLAPLLFVPLREQFGFSFGALGALVMINFVTQVGVDLGFAKAIDRYGFRGFTVWGHVLCGLGFVLFAFTPQLFPNSPYIGFVLSTILFSAGGGLLEILLSPIIDAIPGDEKAMAMSLLHSFYAWGQVTLILITTLFLFVFGTEMWPIMVLLWAIIPLANSVYFTKVPIPKNTSNHETLKILTLVKNPIFIIAALAIMFGAASEVSMNQWASTFMEKGLLLPKVYGDLGGMCLFAIMLGVGRAIYGFYGSKFNVNNAMILGAVLAFFAYLTVAFSTNTVISLVACALCGIFVSLLWPGTLVVASEKLPMAGASMFALLAASGDIGAAVGPSIVGYITDTATSYAQTMNLSTQLTPEQFGLRIGIFGAMIFPLFATFMFILLKRQQTQEAPIEETVETSTKPMPTH